MPGVRGFALGVLALLFAGTALPARGASAAWLQPADARQGLTIELDRSGARVHQAGSVRRLRLRPGERLTTVAELADGWLAAGIVERRDAVDLLLVDARGGAPRRLEAPAAGGPSWRTRPVPLVEDGTLAGLAWLEGTAHGPYLVRAAAFEADGWAPPVSVAPPLAGSQTGLAGTVLADGDWLLVWSRYDGEDDELVWSRGRGATWSPPRPVAGENDVPDVTPALFPAPDGPLVAWDRMVAGEYHVWTARFDGAAWSPARRVAGPGALAPAFAGTGGRPYLLLRQASPRGWAVLELDVDGAALRRAFVPGAAAGRPVLGWSGARDGELVLPGAAAPAPLDWEVVP